MTTSPAPSGDNVPETEPGWQQSLPPDARCLHCGYLLAGLSQQRCPECGQAFVPTDLSTVATSHDRFGWWRKPRVPGLVHALLTAVLTVLLIEPMTRPYGLDLTVQLLLPLYTIAGVGLVTYYILLIVGSMARQGAMISRQAIQHRWRWWVLPVCVLLVVLSDSTDLPLQARFRLSRRALEAAAKAALAGKAAKTPVWIGLYSVEGIVVDGSSVLFETGGTIRSSGGFVYQYKPGEYISSREQTVSPWSIGGLDPW